MTTPSSALQPSSLAQIQSEAPSLAQLAKGTPDLPIFTPSSPSFPLLTQYGTRSTEKGAGKIQAVIRPATEAHVSAAVATFASAAAGPDAISFSIRSGGNDLFGRSRPSPGGIALDIRSLDGITVAADRKTVTIGGGVRFIELLKRLDADGVETPCPWAPCVGCVGWACGGGYSAVVGRYGMGADQIVDARVVVASGEVIRASDDEGLLWALRGGGAGVVGVVTELTIKVYPVKRCLGGNVAFPVAEAEKVLGGLGDLCREGVWPDAFSGEMMVVDLGTGAGVVLNMVFVWSLNEDGSDEAQAKEYLDKVLGLGTVLHNTVKQTTFKEFTELWPDVDQTSPQIYTTRTRAVPGWSANLGKLVAANPPPLGGSCLVIHSSHGAASTPQPAASFANREQHLQIGIAATVPNDELDPNKASEAADWCIRMADIISKSGLVMNTEYINFSQSQNQGASKWYGDRGADIMRKLKARLDPGTVFYRDNVDLKET